MERRKSRAARPAKSRCARCAPTSPPARWRSSPASSCTLAARRAGVDGWPYEVFHCGAGFVPNLVGQVFPAAQQRLAQLGIKRLDINTAQLQKVMTTHIKVRNIDLKRLKDREKELQQMLRSKQRREKRRPRSDLVAWLGAFCPPPVSGRRHPSLGEAPTGHHMALNSKIISK